MLSPIDFEAEWDAAIKDAGIKSGCVRHWMLERLGAVTGANAVWLPPGDHLVEDDEFPDAARLAQANAPENINLHRIALRPQHDRVRFAALLRHELEHARQYDALGPKMVRLHRFVRDAVLAHRPHEHGCSGDLINSLPAELDANAAASVYLLERYPDAVPAMCRTDDRALACSRRPPVPFETLPARTVAFAFVHRGSLRDETASGMSLEEVLHAATRVPLNCGRSSTRFSASRGSYRSAFVADRRPFGVIIDGMPDAIEQLTALDARYD